MLSIDRLLVFTLVLTRISGLLMAMPLIGAQAGADDRPGTDLVRPGGPYHAQPMVGRASPIRAVCWSML